MNTYLIASETIYFMNEKLKELKNGMDNTITFNLQENSMDEVLEEASYFSMFNDDKCLIVKNANFFSTSKDTNKNKEDSEKLLKYLEHENPHTRIIFLLNGKVDNKKKIVNLLKQNNHLFIYASISKTEIKNELKKIVTKNKYQIDDNTLWYIINNSNGSFDLAINELKKIMLYYSKPGIINYDDVTHLVAKTISENNFKLVDSIISKDLSNSLLYLNEAKIFKVEPSVIIALLYREFRLMLQTIIYQEEKYSYSNILKELKLADWQMQKVENNLRMYRKKEIEEEIVKLGKLDYGYKSGKINKDTILINYILDLCL